MKFFAIFTMLLSLTNMAANVAEAKDGDTRENMIGVSDVYIPSGFDTGSEVFVVANGLFPNSCYRFKSSRVDHIGENLHEVRNYAEVTEGLCLTVMIPFHREIQLGKLVAGAHTIRFMNGDGTYMEKRISIE